MTRISKAEKEEYRMVLEKHQKKHPGCKLNERRCKPQLSDECIVKGDKSEFHKTAATCKHCISVINHQYYEKVTAVNRKKPEK
jgi:hypothetical protein